jgi:intracellular sulfur oxidation DsrE/DsrF family protein
MQVDQNDPAAMMPPTSAVIVPSGVVRLMELQEKGWSYVRP